MNYKDIFLTYSKFVDYSLSKSNLSIAGDDLQNIKESGNLVEEAIKSFICQFIPKRYAVVSGYIVKAEDREKEPLFSNQLDMIIVDTLVPHSFYMLNEQQTIQIVPAEAVVGVFEIKRTLNKKNLADAEKQLAGLNKILTKNSKEIALPGGVLMGKGLAYDGCAFNPMFGIIGLKHEEADCQKSVPAMFDQTNEMSSNVDIVFSLDGYLHATLYSETNRNLFYHSPRKDEMVHGNVGGEKTQVLAAGIGFIQSVIQQLNGRRCNSAAYFFNRSIKETK